MSKKEKKKEISEDNIRLIELLKEKGISIEDFKTMVELQVDTALEESKVEEEGEIEVEPEPEEVEPEPKIPTFTKEDLKQLISEEVKNTLKIKLKVPSKGKTINKDDLGNEPESIKKNWYEFIV